MRRDLPARMLLPLIPFSLRNWFTLTPYLAAMPPNVSPLRMRWYTAFPLFFPFSSGIADSYGAATGLKNFWFIIIDTILVVNEVTHYLSRQS